MDENQEPSEDRAEVADRPPAAPPAPQPRGEMSWGLGIALLLGLIVVVFAVQNTDSVQISFLAWSWTTPLAFVIFLVAVISAIADELFGLVSRRRRRRRKSEKEELKRLRAETRDR